jgi:7-carboxy-7-deazaguanine synthase (Cx14CxxC type)
MTYSVKEIFFTLQGEGGNTGRPAVFCRFAGCNLWSGLEKDRATAQCSFCDTEFVGTDGLGGGKFDTSKNLAEAVRAEWPVGAGGTPLVVCTGGEPLLQLDEDLVTALHSTGFQIAIETNGTLAPPPGIDWVCVSPKAGTELVVTSGDELKLIFPQAGAEPELYEDLHFRHFFLQPMDNANREENIQKTVAYCLAHPKWRLSLQTHKFLGIP